MKLDEVLNNISYRRLEGKTNIAFDSASSDSRFLSSRTLFIIKDGRRFSGMDFVKAVKPKAVAFIAEEKYFLLLKRQLKSKEKTLILVASAEKACRQIASYFLKKASRVRIAGITGTNGKTTTAYLLWHILNASRKKASLVSTVDYILPAHKIKSFLTTPDMLTFADLVRRTYEAGGGYLVSEISSHALAQGRIQGVKLDAAVFTNLTEDHLDYHKDIDSYFKAKCKIFDYLRPEGDAWLNADDAFCRRAYSRIRQRRFYFGLQKGELYPRAYRCGRQGIEILLAWENKTYLVKSRLQGVFNVYNILAALGCAFSLGVKPAKAVEAVKTFLPPPGRMEEVRRGVFVDYAHTPDALEKALVCVKEDMGFKKVILVFGCGGERDKKKRPLMGKIASFYSDHCIITNDNPRRENPRLIIEDILKGIKNEGRCRWEVLPEREKAIKKALRMKKGDSTAVLIAGKGHEPYQIIGERHIKFSDRRVVNKAGGRRR